MDQTERDRVGQQVVGQFPAPLSAAYHRAFLGSVDSENHEYLLDLFEVTLKYCSSIVVSQYFRDGVRDPTINESLRNLQKPSLGHWQAWLRDILAHYHDKHWPLMVPEVAVLYEARHTDEVLEGYATLARMMHSQMGYNGPGLGNQSSVKTRQFFDLLVTYRNGLAHAGAYPTTQFRAEVAETLGPALTQLMGKLSFLGEYKLAYVREVKVEPLSARRYAYHLTYLVGENPRVLPAPEYLDDDSERSHEVYLLDRGEGFRLNLSLHPWLIYEYCKRCDRQRTFLVNSGANDALEYVSFQCAHRLSRTDYHAHMRDMLTSLEVPALVQPAGEVVTTASQATPPPVPPTPASGLTPSALENAPPAPHHPAQTRQPPEPLRGVVEPGADLSVPAGSVRSPAPEAASGPSHSPIFVQLLPPGRAVAPPDLERMPPIPPRPRQAPRAASHRHTKRTGVRWAITVGAVGLVLAATLIFRSMGNHVGDTVSKPTPIPSGSDAAPVIPLEALTNYVPSAYRATCVRQDPALFQTAVLSTRCSLDAKTGVWYYYFRTASDLSSAYNQANLPPVSGGDCRTSPEAENTYKWQGKVVGRYFCFPGLDPGVVQIWWTFDSLKILAAATRRDGDRAALYQSWLNAGPEPTPP